MKMIMFVAVMLCYSIIAAVLLYADISLYWLLAIIVVDMILFTGVQLIKQSEK
jgi:hypothetical protein